MQKDGGKSLGPQFSSEHIVKKNEKVFQGLTTTTKKKRANIWPIMYRTLFNVREQ